MRLGTALGMAALAAGLGFGGAARAADMPAYNYAPAGDTPADTPLTFGSGWYLRGDASFGPEDRPKLTLDPAARIDSNATSFGYGFGAGAGYKFNEFLRVDVTGDYLDPIHEAVDGSCGSDCSIVGHSTIQRFDGLANGYVDLGTWWGISPYVGGGVGVAGTSARGAFATTTPASVATTTVPEGTGLRFAWAAMAGITYPVSPHMLLDVGYRYLDVGKTPILLLPGLTVSRDLSAQQVRVGIRYMVD